MTDLATFGSGGSEPYAHALLRDEQALYLHAVDGSRARIDVTRWTEDADPVDRALLRRARGPVLDIGCGPGRMVKAAVQRGMKALGVDVSPVAVEIVRAAGLPVHLGSIFDPIPHEGSWSTALLLDGNIGIGGSPVRLLARIGALLRNGGELLVELEPPGGSTCSTLARLESDGVVSSWFPWARVAVAEIAQIAHAGGFLASKAWPLAGRWFARLHRDDRRFDRPHRRPGSQSARTGSVP